MSTHETVALGRSLDPSAVQPGRRVDPAVISDYWALTKPEVNFLIVVTTFAGFYVGLATESRGFPFELLINTLLGTLLVASGAGTLNQYIERRYDALMRRTSRRPLAAGRLSPSVVLRFGTTLSVLGGLYLGVAVNGLASLLAIITLVSYLFLYTPLKRKTPLCTVVGAVSGAMPPLIGWAGASGRLTFEAWILFALIFLWQCPHFMAIAWMYRDDYDRAGYLVLPQNHTRSRFATQQTLLPLLVLLPLSVAAGFAIHGGVAYSTGASLLGLGFLYYGVQFALHKSVPSARRLLAASIIYLPLLFVMMILVTS
jgi:protoheme IX farnesyltransferase